MYSLVKQNDMLPISQYFPVGLTGAVLYVVNICHSYQWKRF